MKNLLLPRANPRSMRYALALLATILVLLIRQAIDPMLGPNVPYLVMFPAIVFSAWYCGLGPAVITTILAFFGEQYWFIPPLHTLAIAGLQEWVSATVYFAVSVVIIVFAEISQRASAALRRSYDEIENRVEERTRDLQAKNAELVNQTEIVHQLSRRLLQVQDEERRRIARDLHDSLGQLAVALNLNLSSIKNLVASCGPNESRLLDDSVLLVQELLRQVRTISHLLHPPLLDEVGLPSAVRWYVEEFSKRSNIQVTLELPDKLDRLSQDAETSVFRVIQECLTNVHRHSESSVAGIRVACNEDELMAEVWDRGKGISPENQIMSSSAKVGGVGIRGMRERLRQFGGTLDVKSGHQGTRVVARIPLRGINQLAFP
jgi:signal transduction histidine kinase